MTMPWGPHPSDIPPTSNGAPVVNEEWEREKFARFEELVANAMLSRADLIRKVLDPRRNIEDECGHPQLDTVIDPWKYQQVFNRDPVARRAVQIWPHECWKVCPTVYESEDSDAPTAFEEAWDGLARTLREGSYFQDEEGSPIWEYLRRADVQSGIGSYGIILLGLDDGRLLNEPVEGVEEQYSKPVEITKEGPNYLNGKPISGQFYGFSVNAAKTKGRQLKYLRVFPESLCQISQTESNPSSPRYMQPVMYTLTLADPKGTYAAVGMSVATVQVHWTRVIHIADNLDSSEYLGCPRLQPIWDPILDLRKLYGGSAEMYWRGAFPGYTLETHPQLGGDVRYDKSDMKDMMENWSNGLQRMLALAGWSMKSHAPQVADPTSQIQAQLQRICIQIDVPQRIFMGSERGELSSAQDKGSWEERLVGRRRNHLTPRVIVPFVDRLILVGVLPNPGQGAARRAVENARASGYLVRNVRGGYQIEAGDNTGRGRNRDTFVAEGGYSVEWPSPEQLTDAEKADVALKLSQVLSTYAQSGADTFFPPFDFLVTVFGLDEEEAQAILKNASKRLETDGREEAGGSPLLGLVGGVTGMIELFKLAQTGGLSEEQLKQQIMLFYGLSEGRAEDLIAEGLTPTAEEAGMGMETEVEKERTMIDKGVKVDPLEKEPPAPIKVKAGEKLITPPFQK